MYTSPPWPLCLLRMERGWHECPYNSLRLREHPSPYMGDTMCLQPHKGLLETRWCVHCWAHAYRRGSADILFFQWSFDRQRVPSLLLSCRAVIGHPYQQ